MPGWSGRGQMQSHLTPLSFSRYTLLKPHTLSSYLRPVVHQPLYYYRFLAPTSTQGGLRAVFGAPKMLQQNRKRPRQAPRRLPPFQPFPFFRVPLLVQEMIVKRMDALDSVTFSFGSERYRKLLKLLKLRSETIHFHFVNHLPRICLQEGDRHISILTSQISTRKRGSENLRLNGVPTEMEIQKSAMNAANNSLKLSIKVANNLEDTHMEAMERITRHLMQFLIPAKVKVTYSRPWGLDNLFVWAFFKKFNEIQIGHNNSNHGFSETEICHVLENVKAKHLNFWFKRADTKLRPFLERWWSEDDVEYGMDQMSFSMEMDQQQFFQICAHFDAVATGFSEEEILSTSPFFTLGIRRGVQRDITRKRDGHKATLIYMDDVVTIIFWNKAQLILCGREKPPPRAVKKR